MKALGRYALIVVLQRVSRAGVRVGGECVARIGAGVVALVAVEEGDSEREADWCSKKVCDVRIFPDGDDKMNLSVRDVGGAVLAVSQFTLVGDLRKGSRPSFSRAARPEVAKPLFERFAEGVRHAGVPMETGVFQAMMEVDLVNTGPVTLILRRNAGNRHLGDE